jgi:hypothetical protein
MIKLVYCISKKANLSDEEFFRYWKDVHGPLGAKIPRLRKRVSVDLGPLIRATFVPLWG